MITQTHGNSSTVKLASVKWCFFFKNKCFENKIKWPNPFVFGLWSWDNSYILLLLTTFLQEKNFKRKWYRYRSVNSLVGRKQGCHLWVHGSWEAFTKKRVSSFAPLHSRDKPTEHFHRQFSPRTPRHRNGGTAITIKISQFNTCECELFSSNQQLMKIAHVYMPCVVHTCSHTRIGVKTIHKIHKHSNTWSSPMYLWFFP